LQDDYECPLKVISYIYVMKPDQQNMRSLIKRIVDAVNPLKIILFGSAAREQMGPDSDVDIMVVMPDGTHRLNTMGFLHRQMIGLPLAVDIIVATPSDLEKHKNTIGLVYKTILEEGREIYAAT